MCGDPERLWFPQRAICYATRERESAWARYRALHEKAPWHDGTESSWSEKQDVDHPYHFDHGVTVWVASQDVNPSDDFLAQGLGDVPDGAAVLATHVREPLLPREADSEH